ncbi:MAG: lipid A deacylase LpxR family protein [Ferruginibacter sp.]
MRRFQPIALLFIFIIRSQFITAQVTDNTSSFRNTNSNQYIRLHYDNDFFTKSDEYYTQGITLEYANPALQHFLFSKLLFKPKNSEYKYGIALQDFGYTPTSIASDSILYGDRPFCGNLALSTFLIATDALQKKRIAVTFTAGLMGQGAGGEEMQTDIHRWLKNPIPHGWQYQIRNDIILTYEINYEKKLLSYRNYFLLNAAANLKAGTQTDRLKAGFNFMAGKFNDPYETMGKTRSSRKKIRYYLYGQLQPAVTLYDATLQGGLFNRSSPYTIPASDVNRLTLQGDYGIVVSFRKIFLEYTQSILTREFETGHYHRWGGFRIGLDF